jgi:hypothetical protein
MKMLRKRISEPWVWNPTPDVSKDFAAARDYIVKRLQTLLDQIARAKR